MGSDGWQTVKAPKSREAPSKGTQSVQESEPTATASVFHALDVDYDRVSLTSVPIFICVLSSHACNTSLPAPDTLRHQAAK